MIRIGIDLGGSKTELIALDSNGQELLRYRESSPRFDYDATLQTIVKMVNNAEEQLNNACSVGIGAPGAISKYSGLVKNSNSSWLNNKPFLADLQHRLNRPIRIQNDANCFVLSEATDGAASHYNVVLGVIIGTGVGAGITVGGNLILGANSIAGEWGHNSLPWPQKEELPGPKCYCGKFGCIETYLSSPGMVNDHEKATGQKLNSKSIVENAINAQSDARATLDRYIDRMARALANVINILDPNVIVLGGGMGNIAKLYSEIPKLLRRYVFSDTFETCLVAPKFGDSSGVRGAAWLWNQSDFDMPL